MAMFRLNPDELEVASFAIAEPSIEDSVIGIGDIRCCTGCVSGCGINPTAGGCASGNSIRPEEPILIAY